MTTKAKAFYFQSAGRGPLDEYSEILAELIQHALRWPPPPDRSSEPQKISFEAFAYKRVDPKDIPPRGSPFRGAADISDEEAAYGMERHKWREKAWALGERLHKIDGHASMITAHDAVFHAVGGRVARSLESAWNGIGDWYS